MPTYPLSFEHVLRELRDNVDGLTIEDPASPFGNDLSDLLGHGIRNQLSVVAANTLATIDSENWKGVFGQLGEASEKDVFASFKSAAAEPAARSRPWCNPKRLV